MLNIIFNNISQKDLETENAQPWRKAEYNLQHMRVQKNYVAPWKDETLFHNIQQT